MYYYMCRGKDRGCQLEYIPAKAIEVSVINEIREIAARPDVIARYLKQRAAETERANRSLTRERTSLQRQIDAATRAKEGKVKWLIEAMPEKAVAAEIGREIQKQVEGINRLKSRLAEVESKIQENRASSANSDVIARLLKQFVERFDSLDTTQKRLSLQHLVKEVVVKGRHDARAVFVLPMEGDLPLSSHPPARDSDGGFLDGNRHHEVPLGLLAKGQMTPLHQNWGPGRDVAGTEFGLKRRFKPVKPVSVLLPEPEKASFGVRLRFLRRKAGLSLDDLAAKSGLSRNVLSRLERGKTRKANLPWVLGKILPFLAGRFKEAFPEAKGDPYDFLIPPSTFGGWLKNLRMRRGLKLIDLARALKVRPYTVIRYEANETKPAREVRENLRRAYRLNGELDRFFDDAAPRSRDLV